MMKYILIVCTLLAGCSNQKPGSPTVTVDVEAADEFISIIKAYVESCKSNDTESYLKVTSKDKVNSRRRESGNKLINLSTIPSYEIENLENAFPFDGFSLKANKDFARLILFSNKTTPTTYPPPEDAYRALITYIFFKKEGGGWKFHDSVSALEWDPVKQSDFAEHKLDIDLQLNRHSFRYLSYNFPITASISEPELKKIIRLVRGHTKDRIIAITRAAHDDDLSLPYKMHGNILGQQIQLKDPSVLDTKLEVMTSQADKSGNSYGEIFHFKMVDGNWTFDRKGSWLE